MRAPGGIRFALAVAAAWVAPWRAVRTIREQRRDIKFLMHALAYAATRDSR